VCTYWGLTIFKICSSTAEKKSPVYIDINVLRHEYSSSIPNCSQKIETTTFDTISMIQRTVSALQSTRFDCCIYLYNMYKPPIYYTCICLEYINIYIENESHPRFISHRTRRPIIDTELFIIIWSRSFSVHYSLCVPAVLFYFFFLFVPGAFFIIRM
jgi:hypothetical protein